MLSQAAVSHCISLALRDGRGSEGSEVSAQWYSLHLGGNKSMEEMLLLASLCFVFSSLVGLAIELRVHWGHIYPP